MLNFSYTGFFLFQIPSGVTKCDWDVLADKDSVPCDIADSVVKIIQALRERLKLDSPTYTGITIPTVGSMRKLSTKKRKVSDLSKMNTFVLKSLTRERKSSHT